MKIIKDSTPSADGFRMPAEFEPHAGCIMIFPELSKEEIEDVLKAYLNVAKVLWLPCGIGTIVMPGFGDPADEAVMGKQRAQYYKGMERLNDSLKN